MPEQARHEMIMERTHESGAEEWACPVCGRRFLMQWPPNYKKIILEPGDEYAIHSGGKGGLVISDADPQPAPDPDQDDERLAPFKKWNPDLFGGDQ